MIRKFGRKFQGYDPVEVDEALGESAAEIGALRQRAEELSRSVLELETQLKDYRTLEKAMRQTLQQAQETGATAMEQARKEARMIIQEAELKAARIVDKAGARLTILNEQVTILKAKKDSIVTRLSSLLKSELDLVRTLAAEEEPPAVPAPGDEAAADPLNPANPADLDEILRHLNSGRGG